MSNRVLKLLLALDIVLSVGVWIWAANADPEPSYWTPVWIIAALSVVLVAIPSFIVKMNTRRNRRA